MRSLWGVVLSVMFVVLLPGCGHRGPTVTEVPTGISLQEICARYNVLWSWDGVTQVVILEYRGSKAKALVGSNTVLIGKEKIMLSAPIRRQNSTIYVPDDFESKVIAPFGVSKGGVQADWSRFKIKTIVIDPGHGGKDPGAGGRSGLKEKEVVLDVAKRVKMLLEQEGLKIIMTRSTDEFITLPERTEIASKSDADLFVSIHANSNPAKKTEGMEVYYVKTRTKSDLDEEQRQKNEKMFTKNLSAQYSPVLVGIVGDMMYAHKTAESLKLAQMVVHKGSSYAQALNRGARNCRFFVVRNTLVPAILIEVGYLTNRHEEKKLGTSLYRQKMAEAIAKSIIEYATNS